MNYRPMPDGSIAACCLHGGAFSSSNPLASCDKRPSASHQWAVSPFLAELTRTYGACAIQAIDDGDVVGQLRFYPEAIVNKLIHLCVQASDGDSLAISAPKALPLPSKADLPSLVLCIHCAQVLSDYYGRGVGKGMLSALIGWARAEGWREIRAKGIQHIPPLLHWSGCYSINTLSIMGFRVIRPVASAVTDGITNMRSGAHGPEVQQQWEPYSHLKLDEAAQMWEMCLAL